MSYDLVIRNGTIVDGLGGEPYPGDVAVSDGVIAAVGTVPEKGEREIDATGLLVTPGFVDLHTHYDGQAIWSDRMTPSSAHGVTTAVMGNCGVGFAPCRPEDHDTLVDVMAGVEDIPGVVMVDGLPWTWETFPEFLDALDSRQRDIDVAAFLPHSPLRVYVMGERGVNRELPTPEDLAMMRKLAEEAIRAGALGFASSRLTLHKTSGGQPIPSYEAQYEEIEAIARGVDDAGGGLLQFVPDLMAGDYEGALSAVFDVASDVGLPVTFTLAIGNAGPPIHLDALRMVEKANANGGDVTGQIFPRPIGLVLGLDLSGNPFVMYPAYREIADLPLAERVAEMRKPEVRERILNDKPASDGHPLMFAAQAWNYMFPLGDPPNYEPSPEDSIGARAAARGVSPLEEAYDRLLDDDGHAMLLVTLANFRDNSLDTVAELIQRDDVVLGLGDGGAHYGMICDASFPTYMLTHWVRDRPSGRLSVQRVIQELTSVPARIAGLADRGRLAVGYKADVNVIDADALRLHQPTVKADLPAGGRRLDQTADGYVATIVAGEVISENGVPTSALPGKLIRGRQAAPAPAL
ncbi:N-acyl-D-amino-acid deacylase family protein [Mycolicibacterium aichiense]|uniref:Amidohydrolase n=1 Tax=Mycolicibacterium aichiense TaxID=1799 RepID=A0AAD1HSW2_9MYCO|nr:amidohydrolase family protein [Mycolicibacterium aichiense]MCV7017434.1 amidohydrolase family protein [Mycolicibacterium aichiense]BBX10133.1 amidohydrolase [Mycolicibacterium aichiense]STZ26200.1 N-acyl-D-aspartate/D-glutamate deacylase [Mycolicibacterium aichiense]